MTLRVFEGRVQRLPLLLALYNTHRHSKHSERRESNYYNYHYHYYFYLSFKNIHSPYSLLSLSLSLSRALSQSLISIKVIAWVPLNATFSFIQEFYSVSVPLTSVTRLGDFWNILAKIFITKVTQMFGDFLDSCEKCHFRSNWLCYFLGNFWKNLGYFLFQHLVTLSVCCPPLRRFSHYSISSTLTGERNSTDTLCKWHRLESSFF